MQYFGLRLNTGEAIVVLVELEGNYFMVSPGMFRSKRDNFMRITETAFNELRDYPDEDLEDWLSDESKDIADNFIEWVQKGYPEQLK